ncbi:MAG: CPBP family glutamic-type intramembrane protease [Planctomycetota bacterium]
MNTRKIGFGILVAILFLLPYAQEPWWEYFHSSLVLVLLFRAIGGPGGATRLGLGMKPLGWVYTCGVFLPLFVGAGVLQAGIARSAGISHAWSFFPANVDPLFQALNEELILGYVLLWWLVKRLKRPHLSAWILAVFFAAMHLVFYRWISTLYDSWLTWQAVATLLLVGVCRNYLILLAGHVGYAWAIHGAWNLWFFGGSWTEHARLGEPELFNTFLGHPASMAVTLVLAGASLLLVAKWGLHGVFLCYSEHGSARHRPRPERIN